jgi:hypothetical protein
MKTSLRLQFASASAFLLTLISCASRKSESTQTASTVQAGGSVSGSVEKTEALDDYGGDEAADPVEKLNLAVWGFGQGSYAVLPIIGPGTLRDGLGLIGDTALNPISWLFLAGGSVVDLRWIPATTNTVRLMPSQLELYDQATANSVDPYHSVKSIYLQSRKLLEAQ